MGRFSVSVYIFCSRCIYGPQISVTPPAKFILVSLDFPLRAAAQGKELKSFSVGGKKAKFPLRSFASGRKVQLQAVVLSAADPTVILD